MPGKPCLSRAAAIVFLLAMVGTVRAAQIDIPGPNGSVDFGADVAVLPNGNIAVVDPNGGFSNSGVVHLYSPAGQRLSSFSGAPGDHVGSGGIVLVGNGNFIVRSPHWNSSAGAVTFVNGTTGLSPSFVTPGNSLVGTHANDAVGTSVTVLSNGNYVVLSPNWNGTIGAATWGNSVTGVAGQVAASNSLVGSNSTDRVGYYAIALSNGNYVVASPFWSSITGAATWGNGTVGAAGVISAGNSLVGAAANDYVGYGGITALSNGNYVVASPHWNGNIGAATLCDGATGESGTVSASNSLVGSKPGDQAGYYVVALSNGNYVAASPFWHDSIGAATWGHGTKGIDDVVSEINSLVGTAAGDRVGEQVYALSNGNYVVASPDWNGTVGAATWGNGATGQSGTVSAGNSLVGAAANDHVGIGVTALGNGNYAVASPHWNGDAGAVTWGNGATGVSGIVSAGNSLISVFVNDRVGQKITALSNGNYVVASPDWYGGRGAATWRNGAASAPGTVSSGNSLVGAAANDYVGNLGVTALSNGNYVVRSPDWQGFRGAATWGNGATGVKGTVSASNSLVGANLEDGIGRGDVAALSDGSYVVATPDFLGGIGAVTLASGTYRLVGTIQSWNSVIGTAPDGGHSMPFAYDAARGRLVVGRQEDNMVSLFTLDQIFAGSFE